MPPFNKIMLVDDDEATNVLAELLLRRLNAAKEIVVADNGQIACTLIRETGCPDLIFLDMRMPHMDGFEFLDCLSEMDTCKLAKVIMVSSMIQQEERDRALSYAQVLDCLQKPITKEMVEGVVKAYYRPI